MASPVPTPTPAEEHPVRVGHLDGIRAFAILAVVSFHWNKGLIPGVFGGGYIGVDAFLTLSGFLITSILVRRRAADDRAGFRRFFAARIRRLYPALTAVVVLVPLITVALPGPVADRIQPSFASLALTMLQLSWIPVIGHWGSHAQLLIHCWSLAVEWTFYAVWPWILWKLLADRRRAWLYVAVGSVLVWLVCATLLPWQWFYASPLARAAQIGAGCALALYVHEKGASAFARVGQWTAAAFSLLAIGFLGYWTLLGPNAGASYRWGVFALVPLATVALIVGGFRSASVSRLLSVPLLRGIGLVSYSIYLWHVPLMLITNHQVIGTTRGVSALSLLVSTAVLSPLTYWLLERPYFKKRQPAASLVSTRD